MRCFYGGVEIDEANNKLCVKRYIVEVSRQTVLKEEDANESLCKEFLFKGFDYFNFKEKLKERYPSS